MIARDLLLEASIVYVITTGKWLVLESRVPKQLREVEE